MAMAYDAARGEVVLFGGQGEVTKLGDTWTWDGTAWTQEHPSVSPTPRCCMGMTYDAAREVVVLFGGFDELGYRNDTWTWNGTTWTKEHPATVPSPRSDFGMAYHAESQQVVIFGGYGGGLEPTYTWDGVTWTKEDPVHKPQFVYGPGMTEYGDQVVMFGGEFVCIEELCYERKTWQWNGQDWIPRGGRAAPSNRAYVGMADDTGGREVVLFGGERQSTQLGDTWTWEGSTWVSRRPPTSPPRRWSMGMAYDALRQNVVLFGGEYYADGDYRFLADTWTWDGASWERAG